MTEIYYTISPEIFQKYPGYVRGIVVANHVKNQPSPEELVALLRKAEEELRTRLKIENLLEEPYIKSWRDAFRAFGAKPSDFRSSIEAMSRRVLRGDPLPSINALADIGNIISLRHLVPTGGHAIDHLTQDISLRLATGQEIFVPFGSDQVEHPTPGEVIFAEGNTVLTSKWTWRQANHTLTLLETEAIEFNVDGLLPVTPQEVEQICAEITSMIGQFCGGEMRSELLSQEHPRMKLMYLLNN
jgi:DNA/RNA-binding domain of Phe-tRNA-synthetase-like protein